jgi:hypothetical protein
MQLANNHENCGPIMCEKCHASRNTAPQKRIVMLEAETYVSGNTVCSKENSRLRDTISAAV